MAEQPPGQSISMAVGYASTFPFAMIGYKITEGALGDAGWSRWPTIGVASLGGLVGATIGTLIVFKWLVPRFAEKADS